jgi:hypothetical protein
VELNTDLGIEGGPLSRLLQLGDMPLLLDSTIRIDRSGLKLQGVADAKLAPGTLLESGGVVEAFVPFQRLSDAYVRVGGDLSVPILGITAGNEAMLGGGQGDERGQRARVTARPVRPTWWDEATTWIGERGQQHGQQRRQRRTDRRFCHAGRRRCGAFVGAVGGGKRRAGSFGRFSPVGRDERRLLRRQQGAAALVSDDWAVRTAGGCVPADWGMI